MKTKIASVIAVLTLSLLPVFNAFADNPYGMDYIGGEPLGSDNVQIEPTLLDNLTSLAGNPSVAIITEISDGWEYGYSPACKPVIYVAVKDGDIPNSNLSFAFATGEYLIRVNILDIDLEYLTDTASREKPVSIMFNLEGNGFFDTGYAVFKDAECTENTVYRLGSSENIRIYVKANVKLFKKGESGPFVSDDMYMKFGDIDHASSFKILNSSDLLSTKNMYAVSEEALQPTNTTQQNMYVLSNNYIYSSYDGGNVVATDYSNIYVKLSREAQENGIDLVIGGAKAGGIGIGYLTREYTVGYASDKNGKLTGSDSEKVASGRHPSSTAIKVADGYELKYWTADKDVKLSDGKTIAAGKPILASQLKQVVVNSDITFKAIHGIPEPNKEESPIAVPNTGSSTSETNAALVSISVFGVLLGALIIGILPKLHHKKIGFKKM